MRDLVGELAPNINLFRTDYITDKEFELADQWNPQIEYDEYVEVGIHYLMMHKKEPYMIGYVRLAYFEKDYYLNLEIRDHLNIGNNPGENENVYDFMGAGIDPKYRGIGLSKLSLEMVIKDMLAHGMRYMSASILVDNTISQKALKAHEGFEQYGVMELSENRSYKVYVYNSNNS